MLDRFDAGTDEDGDGEEPQGPEGPLTRVGVGPPGPENPLATERADQNDRDRSADVRDQTSEARDDTAEAA